LIYGVSSWFVGTDVNSQLLSFKKNINHRTCIKYIYALAYKLAGYTIVMLIYIKTDVVIFCYQQPGKIFYFKRIFREWHKMLLLLSQKPFFTAIWLFLHAGLIVFPHFF